MRKQRRVVKSGYKKKTVSFGRVKKKKHVDRKKTNNPINGVAQPAGPWRPKRPGKRKVVKELSPKAVQREELRLLRNEKNAEKRRKGLRKYLRCESI